jgi:hypothetical protein
MRQIFILIVFLLASAGNSLFACTCLGPISVEQGVKESDAVFVGQIISREMIEDSTIQIYGDTSRYIIKELRAKYKVVVLEKFKGNFTQDTLTIITGLGDADCGYQFIVGKKFIIYAYKQYIGRVNQAPATYETDICTRTTGYNEREVEAIRKVIKQE